MCRSEWNLVIVVTEDWTMNASCNRINMRNYCLQVHWSKWTSEDFMGEIKSALCNAHSTTSRYQLRWKTMIKNIRILIVQTANVYCDRIEVCNLPEIIEWIQHQNASSEHQNTNERVGQRIVLKILFNCCAPSSTPNQSLCFVSLLLFFFSPFIYKCSSVFVAIGMYLFTQ